MQRALRMNDAQLLSLSEKALHDNCLRGYLCKRTADSARWQLRWFVLYQNLLFYYENDSTTRPSGVLFLEGSYCERLLTPVTGGKNTGSTQVSPTSHGHSRCMSLPRSWGRREPVQRLEPCRGGRQNQDSTREQTGVTHTSRVDEPSGLNMDGEFVARKRGCHVRSG
ncbi:hypothetical protein HPB51_023840 [Rhipicephalus microplus]|uniref:PH domain-containing protein n=1 Tax=Rhipicephalus microplus TaxID=6941 RepID=A0A9J6FA98_RHIMP|nr:hypothetical protein HPB51_023840 [Rhipicephalus microplus]